MTELAFSRFPRLNVRALCYALVLLALLALAFFYFRINLMLPESADPDEGVYLIVARLLNYGYGYNSFYFDQFWLFPQILAFAFRLFGDTVETGRLTIVVFSLGGLLALARLARQIGFPWAAPFVILFGAVNHYYLTQSRYAMSDVPSMALMLWALVTLLRYTARKQRLWLVVSGALCAGSMLIKPLAVGFIVPLGIWLIAARVERNQGTWCFQWRAFLTDGLVMVVGGILLAAPFVDLFDLHGEFMRTVGFHWDEKDWYAPQLALRQLGLISFAAENRMWLGLAALGALVALLKAPLRAVPLLIAEGVSVLVLVQLPPWWHHYTLLTPVLTLFAGIGAAAGLGVIVQTVRSWKTRGTWERKQLLYRAAVGTFFFFAMALWLHDAPILVQYNLAALNERAHDTTRLVRELRKNYSPGSFFVSDNTIVLFQAGMLMPPSAINLPYESTFRFSALSRDKLYESVTQYPIAAVVVTGPYKHNTKLMHWFETQFPEFTEAGGGESNTVSATIFRRNPSQEQVTLLPFTEQDDTDQNSAQEH